MQIYLNILHIYLLTGFALYGLNKVGAMGNGLGMGTGNSTWGTNDGVTYAELDTIQVSPLTHKKKLNVFEAQQFTLEPTKAILSGVIFNERRFTYLPPTPYLGEDKNIQFCVIGYT